MNKYLATAFILLGIFIIIGVLVSPKASFNAYNNGRLPILKADSSLFLDTNKSHSNAFFNQFMIFATQYGREVFWPVAIILLFILGGWTGKETAIVIAISMLVLIPLGIIAKDIVARPRPLVPKGDFLLSADSEYSFPSGHATIVSAGAIGALSLFRGSPKKLAISLGMALEAALVCISRVYVGGHYPSDVLGGICLGVAVSLIFIGGAKYIESKVIMPIRKLIGK